MIHWLIGIGMAAAQTGPAPGDVPAINPATPAIDVPKAAREGAMTKTDAEALIAKCGPRKFESTAEFNNAGKLRRAKILLCAKDGDSDQQWIATLEKAASQIEASLQLSAVAKAKVISEIQAAIGQVRNAKAAQAQAGQTAVVPIGPPVPTPMWTSEPPLVATVRPLPPYRPPGRVRAIQPPIVKPRLSISCPSAGNFGVATSCSDFAPDTLLVIRADEDLKSRVSLRFVRDGDPRGGIALGMMRRGQVIRTGLPSRVCAGVVRGRVILQTIVTDPHSGAEQVADTQGPYRLHC